MAKSLQAQQYDRDDELAFIADGPWGPAWYWRSDWEAMAANVGHNHPSMPHYAPTNQSVPHPYEPVQARVWVFVDPEETV